MSVMIFTPSDPSLPLIALSSHKVNNRVQNLLLNYHTALLHSGDFTLVYYQTGELGYIRLTAHLTDVNRKTGRDSQKDIHHG